MNSDWTDNWQTSNGRPLPLRRRSDLVVRSEVDGVASERIVKDPVGGKYWRLTREQFETLESLDGKSSLHDLQQRLSRQFPELHPSIRNVQMLVAELHERSLLISLRDSSQRIPCTAPRRSLLMKIPASLLFLKLPGFHPAWLLDVLGPTVRWLFHGQVLAVLAVVVGVCWLTLLGELERLRMQIWSASEFLQFDSLLMVWLAIGLSKVIHELAHGLVCRYWGRDCTEMGMAFLLCSPCLYCDVSDAWLLRERKGRLSIAAAGPIAEVLLATVCLMVWQNTDPGLLNRICLHLGLVSVVSSVLLNLNPLLKYDGYYILSDWLEYPNLRLRADRVTLQMIGRVCLGIPRTATLGSSHIRDGWLIAYSIASWIYRWMIILAIAGFLHGLLKPFGMQWFAVLFIAVHLTAAVCHAFRAIPRIVRTNELGESQMIRGAVALVLLVAGLGGAMVLPLPIGGTAACLIEPGGLRHVYAEQPGILDLALVSAGTMVEKGQPVAQLSSIEVLREADRTNTEVLQREVEFRMQSLGEDRQARVIAEDALRLSHLRRDQAMDSLLQLTLRAPISGRILAGPESSMDSGFDSLVSASSGSCLETSNRGATIPRGTRICSIAPSNSWRAIVYVGGDLKQELNRSQSVDILVDALPGRRFHGTITRIAREGTRDVPPVLLDRHGGAISGDPLSSNAAKTHFRVEVQLQSDAIPAISGLRGTARFTVRQPTLLEWLRRQCSTIACMP